MSDFNNYVSSVRNHLSSRFMYADNEWLTGCVEYILENNKQKFSESEMHSMAVEQWLLNDLRDICPGSLPKDLKNISKIELKGRFVLQVNSATDIGTPAYQQYLKLQKVNMENIEATTKFEDKVPSNRTIKLHLTDGVQDISAMEYKPMRNLSCDITPGCKILVKGPVICRRGLLLLTEDKIQFLGGEVQEMIVENSLPNLLSRKLGIKINLGPNDTGQNFNTSIQPRNTNLPLPSTQMPSFNPNQDSLQPIARDTGHQVSNFANEEIINLDEIEALDAIEAEYINNTDVLTNKRPLNEESGNAIPNPDKKAKMEQNVNNADDYPDECDDMFCDEDEDYLRELEAEFDKKLEGQTPKVKIVPPEPFIYLKQINEMKDDEKCGKVFRIKGQILKLLSKLTVGKEDWSLKCTLIDGTDKIDVDFTTDVLTKLIGYSPREMNKLKTDIVTKPQLKEKALNALQKAKESLQALNCIIEITFLNTPKITDLISFDETHCDLLRKRFNS